MKTVSVLSPSNTIQHLSYYNMNYFYSNQLLAFLNKRVRQSSPGVAEIDSSSLNNFSQPRRTRGNTCAPVRIPPLLLHLLGGRERHLYSLREQTYLLHHRRFRLPSILQQAYAVQTGHLACGKSKFCYSCLWKMAC